MATTLQNKKASQLVFITPSEVMPNDLFYVVDVSAHESKKMTAADLSAYLNASGSLFAVHAINADTASFVLPGGITFIVPSASFASFAGSTLSSSWVSSSVSSSHAITASFSLNGEIGNAQSASFLIYTGVPNGTASFALTSSLTFNTLTSSFLIYNGFNNGTASYALTSQNVNHATSADTASYFNSVIGNVSSASHANIADNSIQAQTASFLKYNGVFNGTASFALNVASVGSQLINYGIFLATTQSSHNSQIDDLLIHPSFTGSINTDIQAIGSATLFFTSSVVTNDSISLSITDRFSGTPQVIDTVPVFWNTTPIMDAWNTLLTGSMSIPFTLLSQITSSGDYLVQVSSTPNVILNGNRTTRFSISSTSDGLFATSAQPIDFSYTPGTTQVIFYSGSTGPFTDSLAGIQATGSQYLTYIDLSNTTISSVSFTWKCYLLQTFKSSNDLFLTSLNYKFPSSLITLIVNNCNLNSISNLSNTQLSYFDCSNNNLSSIPDMPQTQNYSMSYFNCSNNNISSLPLLAPTMSVISCSSNPIANLPSTFPFGLNAIVCDDMPNLIFMTSTFLNGIVSMSFQNNPLLQFWTVPFVSSMVSFNGSNSPIGAGGFPLPPVSMSTIILNTCGLSTLGGGSMDQIFSQSLVNAVNFQLYSGSIDVRGNGSPDVSTFNNYIIPLTGSAFGGTYNWTLLYD